MKGYNGMTFINSERCSGRNQVNACIQASSWQKVAAALPGRTSVYELKLYWHPALNDEMIEALKKYPAGTLLVKGDMPGDTIDGLTGWVRA